MLDIPIENQ